MRARDPRRLRKFRTIFREEVTKERSLCKAVGNDFDVADVMAAFDRAARINAGEIEAHVQRSVYLHNGAGY